MRGLSKTQKGVMRDLILSTGSRDVKKGESKDEVELATSGLIKENGMVVEPRIQKKVFRGGGGG